MRSIADHPGRAPAGRARWIGARPALLAARLTILAVSFLALAACGSSGTSGSLSSLSHVNPAHSVHAKPSGKPIKAGKAAPQANVDMVAAVASSKDAAPVEVRFALRGRPEIGKPVELDIEVTPTAPLARLVASFHAEDGLTIEEGGAAHESDRPEPGVPLSRALTVVASRDGIFYVSATVLVDMGAESVARTFTIPVIAGAGVT